MLEQFLPAIKDPADYLAALSLFKADAPLTAEEAEKLLAVYAKYQTEMDDPDYLRLCLAVDLLPGRTEKDMADFAPLGLGEKNLDALFAAKKIVTGTEELTVEKAAHIVEQVQDETVSLPARVLLARIALDCMAASRDYASLREQITTLAAFLTGCGTETLDRYTTLVGEVKVKCRK